MQYKNIGIILCDLIKINRIENPSNISLGEKIFLKPKINGDNNHSTTNPEKKSGKANLLLTFQKNQKDEWRTFGPLDINWSKWQPFEGSLVAPAVHQNGKPIIIAINCNSTKLTWGGSKSRWERWLTPIEQFEFNILDQACDNKT